MNTNDQELLSAYLDSELGAVESSQLEERLAKEPTLQLRLDKMRTMDETLKSNYRSARARTVSARILHMLSKPISQAKPSDNQVIPFPSRQRTARWSFAVAASVMAASGLLLLQGTGQQLAEQSSGGDPVLAQALESMHSHGEGWDTLSDGRKIRPVLTYARLGGGWCREYILSGGGQDFHGIACRQSEGNWVTEVSEAQAAPSSSTEYRTAGAADSDKVAQFISASAEGIALNREREVELIATRWR